MAGIVEPRPVNVRQQLKLRHTEAGLPGPGLAHAEAGRHAYGLQPLAGGSLRGRQQQPKYQARPLRRVGRIKNAVHGEDRKE